MIITNVRLEIFYDYESPQSATLSFALAAAAGGAYAPRHLQRLIAQAPPPNWRNVCNYATYACDLAEQEAGDSTPAPLTFSVYSDAVTWETCNRTLVMLTPDWTVSVLWPLWISYGLTVAGLHADILESVTRRALTPLGLPVEWRLLADVDGQVVAFPLPPAEPEEIVRLAVGVAWHVDHFGVDCPVPDGLANGVRDGDLVALHAAMDWAEENADSFTVRTVT